MLSPMKRSLIAFVRPVPGISVIILPMIILSGVFSAPAFVIRNAVAVMINDERNFVNILFLTVLSHTSMVSLISAPMTNDAAASDSLPPKNRVNDAEITE